MASETWLARERIGTETVRSLAVPHPSEFLQTCRKGREREVPSVVTTKREERRRRDGTTFQPA
jgi:hypothetical protein